MKKFARTLALLLFTLSSQSLLAEARITPGLWSGTVTMEVPGMPMAMPSHTIKYCVTADDAIPKSDKNRDCQFKDIKTSGNTTSWTMICDNEGNKITAQGKMTYNGTSAKGVINMSVLSGGEKMEMKQTIDAKRIGNCK